MEIIIILIVIIIIIDISMSQMILKPKPGVNLLDIWSTVHYGLPKDQ